MHQRILVSIIMLVVLICFAALLRRMGVLEEKHGPVFGGIVTKITLPALIFLTLSKTHILKEEAWLAAIMVAAEIASLVLAWLACRALKLGKPQTGAVVLTAGFGSSSLLGYPLISHLFASNPQAITEAVVISELGVAPLLFTVGVFIAIYYGSAEVSREARIKNAIKFFYSPIFISVLAGIAASSFGLPRENDYVRPVLDTIAYLADANTFAVALTVGLLLNFSQMIKIIHLVILVGFIKLILKPVMVWLPALGLDLMPWQMQVLVLEAAMPSAMLSVALSASYGCDAKLASKLVFATSVACGFTLLFMFDLLT